jgi:cyclopropane fatty-acyl-phospholipid synthase-like methyltransferase
MKLQILTDIKDCIDGYNPAFLDNEVLNVDVPDNSVSSILMIGSIESVSYKSLDNLLNSVRRILRRNGKVVISGIDVNCISRDLINRVIDAKTYNEVVFSKNGIYDSKELCNKLSSLGLTIEKVTLKGSVYELHASRSN